MSLKRFIRILKRLYTHENLCYIYAPDYTVLNSSYSSTKHVCSPSSIYRHIGDKYVIFSQHEVAVLLSILHSYLDVLRRHVSKAFCNIRIKLRNGISTTVALIYRGNRVVMVTDRGVFEYANLQEFIDSTIKYLSSKGLAGGVGRVELNIPLNGDSVRIRYCCYFTNSILGVVLLDSLVLTLYIKMIVENLCTT